MLDGSTAERHVHFGQPNILNLLNRCTSIIGSSPSDRLAVCVIAHSCNITLHLQNLAIVITTIRDCPQWK